MRPRATHRSETERMFGQTAFGTLCFANKTYREMKHYTPGRAYTPGGKHACAVMFARPDAVPKQPPRGFVWGPKAHEAGYLRRQTARVTMVVTGGTRPHRRRKETR